jgi:D-3-phosphoglycerate dehydrogenase
MLGRINTIFSSRGINIAGQYLQTDNDLGYVVVETQSDDGCDDCLSELRRLDGTIRTRLIRRV